MVLQIIKDWFTARNGVDFSLTKLIAIGGAATMMGEFIRVQSGNYLELGFGLSVLMAALIGKYFIESPVEAAKKTEVEGGN